MTSGHAPTAMIADYAAGGLSPGMSLLLASHLTWCPCCRDKVARLETLGGALFCRGEAVQPGPSCLERALERIEAAAAPPPAAEPRDPPLPRPLCRLVPRSADLEWQALGPGLAAHWLGGFEPERVGLLRASPGARLAAPAAAPEAIFVIAGALSDAGTSYGPGDLAFPGGRAPRPPEAAGEEPCLCLLLLPAGRA
jgi:putative transcriptional regulator